MLELNGCCQISVQLCCVFFPHRRWTWKLSSLFHLLSVMLLPTCLFWWDFILMALCYLLCLCPSIRDNNSVVLATGHDSLVQTCLLQIKCVEKLEVHWRVSVASAMHIMEVFTLAMSLQDCGYMWLNLWVIQSDNDSVPQSIQVRKHAGVQDTSIFFLKVTWLGVEIFKLGVWDFGMFFKLDMIPETGQSSWCRPLPKLIYPVPGEI